MNAKEKIKELHKELFDIFSYIDWIEYEIETEKDIPFEDGEVENGATCFHVKIWLDNYTRNKIKLEMPITYENNALMIGIEDNEGMSLEPRNIYGWLWIEMSVVAHELAAESVIEKDAENKRLKRAITFKDSAIKRYQDTVQRMRLYAESDRERELMYYKKIERLKEALGDEKALSISRHRILKKIEAELKQLKKEITDLKCSEFIKHLKVARTKEGEGK